MAAGGTGSRTFSFKVVLLGEGCVGKTSLVLRYCENKFNDKHITTLQVRKREPAEAGPPAARAGTRTRGRTTGHCWCVFGAAAGLWRGALAAWPGRASDCHCCHWSVCACLADPGLPRRAGLLPNSTRLRPARLAVGCWRRKTSPSGHLGTCRVTPDTGQWRLSGSLSVCQAF